MSTPSDHDQTTLAASYKSPTDTKQFQHALNTTVTTPNTQLDNKSQTTYLSQLRASTKNLQDDINDFLTQKMEEDKKNSLEVSVTRSKTKEEVEEENYGEEVVDDDDTG